MSRLALPLVLLSLCVCAPLAAGNQTTPSSPSPPRGVPVTTVVASSGATPTTTLVPYGEPGGLTLALPADWPFGWIDERGESTFVAVAPDDSGGVQLNHRHYEQAPSVPTFLEQQQRVLQSLADLDGAVLRSQVRLPIGPAERFLFSRRRDGGETVEMYVFSRGTELYQLRLRAGRTERHRLAPVFSAVLLSLAWDRPP